MNEYRDLERQLKRQKISTAIVGVVAAIALALNFVGQGVVSAGDKEQPAVIRHPVLQAQRFELVTEKGNLLAVLAQNKNTSRAVFSLVDEKGASRLYLTLTDDNHGLLAFEDDNKRQRMRLYLNDDYAGQIDLFDEKNHGQVEMQGGEFPYMYMRCGTPYGRVLLTTAKDGATLQLKGEDGDNMASIGVDTEGKPALQLQDKDGKSLFKAP